MVNVHKTIFIICLDDLTVVHCLDVTVVYFLDETVYCLLSGRDTTLNLFAVFCLDVTLHWTGCGIPGWDGYVDLVPVHSEISSLDPWKQVTSVLWFRVTRWVWPTNRTHTLPPSHVHNVCYTWPTPSNGIMFITHNTTRNSFRDVSKSKLQEWCDTLGHLLGLMCDVLLSSTSLNILFLSGPSWLFITIGAILQVGGTPRTL
jgi:hypothetical protein